MKLDISTPAEMDIQDILTDGYTRYGQKSAREYVLGIYSKLNMLTTFPYLGHQRADTLTEILALKVEKRHIALYEIKNNTIYVLRVAHDSSDFTKLNLH